MEILFMEYLIVSARLANWSNSSVFAVVTPT